MSGNQFVKPSVTKKKPSLQILLELRDVIEEYVNVSGVPLKLIDTAGIRETEDIIGTNWCRT